MQCSKKVLFWGKVVLITLTFVAYPAFATNENSNQKSDREACMEYLQRSSASALRRLNILLDAKESGTLVKILSRIPNEFVGKISGFRFENDQLHVIMNSREVPFDSIIGIRQVHVATTLAEISQYFTDNSFLKPMFEAQEKGLTVAASETGVEEVSRGQISNIHTEDGKLVFTVAGKEFRPTKSFNFGIVRESPADEQGEHKEQLTLPPENSINNSEKLPKNTFE